ncbi:MAG: hypothetical protein FJ146_19405 [Deltaproteobacteria bacterium]|nr:hypothetical protein [Deltaproteobacteria bacterium]
MGARATTNKVELMVNYVAFFSRVGAVKNFYELEWLGLTGHDFCGCFDSDELPQLQRFISQKPEFHLVSSLGVGRFANRYCKNASRYLIAKGDRNPALELNFLLDPRWPIDFEDGIAAAIAEINKIKNSGKS